MSNNLAKQHSPYSSWWSVQKTAVPLHIHLVQSLPHWLKYLRSFNAAPVSRQWGLLFLQTLRGFPAVRFSLRCCYSHATRELCFKQKMLRAWKSLVGCSHSMLHTGASWFLTPKRVPGQVLVSVATLLLLLLLQHPFGLPLPDLQWQLGTNPCRQRDAWQHFQEHKQWISLLLTSKYFWNSTKLPSTSEGTQVPLQLPGTPLHLKSCLRDAAARAAVQEGHKLVGLFRKGFALMQSLLSQQAPEPSIIRLLFVRANPSWAMSLWWYHQTHPFLSVMLLYLFNISQFIQV